jgi:hypothetical protein
MQRRRTYHTLKLSLYTFVGLGIIVSYFFFKHIEKEYNAIITFEDCTRAGYLVIATYPEQCKIPGKTFTNTTQTATHEIVEATSTFPEKNMNPKNTSYDIEGVHVLLQNGKSVYTSSTTDTSTSSNTVEYAGNDLRIDVDGDQKEDATFLLTVRGSGSGTFYYLVTALNKDNGYVGTNGILLGDRITPLSIAFKNNEIVATYLDRKIDESMVTKPHVSVSRRFKITNMTLEEITQ